MRELLQLSPWEFLPLNTYLPAPLIQEPLPEEQCVATIITTIHGTWGSKSELARKDSQFCKHLLQKSADPQSTIIRPFKWTGRNNHHERLLAAADLRKFIEENLKKYPKSVQHLVCHSHGGTIAAQALEDLKFGESVDAVVTLSTPFLYVARRPLTSEAASIIKRLGRKRESKHTVDG